MTMSQVVHILVARAGALGRPIYVPSLAGAACDGDVNGKLHRRRYDGQGIRPVTCRASE